MVRVAAKRALIPPDGGWGWMICFAYASNNVIVLPLISGFGLILQERFKEINISATEISIIMIVNYAFGMLLSLFNGPLLKNLGYRRVAIIGSMFVAVGVMVTSRANSFISYLFTYSIITSIGVALVMAAFTLAINSYFNKNRGKAVGLGMSITGLGPILMPQLMYLLIEGYGIQGAILILGALSLHSFAAALLLRPIKWYLIPEETLIELKEVNTANEVNTETQQAPEYIHISLKEPLKIARSMEEFSEDENEYLENDNAAKVSTLSLKDSNTSLTAVKSINSNTESGKARVETISESEKWWDSRENKLDGVSQNNKKDGDDSSEIKSLLENQNNIVIIETTNDLSKSKEVKKTFWQKVVDFFDLTLLKDPIFVNILMGISIAGSAEINFTLLTPFILNDLSFKTHEIAAFMSVVAFADIVFRFISPFIGDMCHQPPRLIYLGSLVFLIFTRSTLFLATSYKAMLVVALALGISKGVRTVYMNLVIPSYVPIERLPFASGIQMPINGIILLTFGPLLGLVRDRSGSYTVPIICINIVTFITIVLWTTEFIYVRIAAKNREKVNV